MVVVVLTPSRSLALHAEAGKPLPKVPDLRDLYRIGVTPRHGEVVMIAGRSGTQKSGLALWMVSEMKIPTLYFSADMSPFTASSRLACKALGKPTEEVERMMTTPEGKRECMDALKDERITFAFGSPITWRAVEQEFTAYVELWDSYPEAIVLDNLMDFENAESDYSEQMAVMSNCTEISRATGSTTFILHHASDKSWDAKTDPYSPPARNDIKNGLAEKPELALTVALDPYSMDYKIACVKQRMGPSDPSARTWATLKCEPSVTRFHAK